MELCYWLHVYLGHLGSMQLCPECPASSMIDLFTAQDNEAIRNAVLRYDITHPVINDARMVLWRDLGVASWPTLLVVSPRGRVIATLPGGLSLYSLDVSISKSQSCIFLCVHKHSNRLGPSSLDVT